MIKRLARVLLPTQVRHSLGTLRSFQRGRLFGQSVAPMDQGEATEAANPLWDYFMAHKSGPGIWKWKHYFEIYHRHFERFRGRDVRVLEIGVFSGGSLLMWRDYFGPQSIIYGVDIEPACEAYETEWAKIFIGDQGNPAFWRHFKAEVPKLDIVIDDGSHVSEHQITTFQELFPFLSPDGVYLCEDIVGTGNHFTAFVYGLADCLNMGPRVSVNRDDYERYLVAKTIGAQAIVKSVSLYPQVAVVEKRDGALPELVAPRHGTMWQPFYD
jgi:hypothetical protein